jgi:5-methylcytosine-specific restriction endonuclease McrA
MREVRRAALMAAIGQPCPYCGEPMAAPTRDHIWPRKRGGTLNGRNTAIVCDPCNSDKGARSLESWLYALDKAGDRRARFVAVLATDPVNHRTRAYIG